MSVAVAILVALAAVGVSLWLGYSALRQIRQVRSELDQTQHRLNDAVQELTETRSDLNDVRKELSELKAAAEVLPPPPPLPRSRSGGLDDLREQLRASHLEEEPSEE
jgi:hypothetical protein